MKWDWNNEIEMPRAQARIIHRFPQPFRDGMPQLQLAIVFELQNDKTNDPAAAISGYGGIESQRSIRAVSTGKHTIDCTGKRLRTFCTKRRDNAGGLIETIPANVIAAGNGRMTDGTQGRVKKRRDRAQRFKSAIDSHNATSQSLTPR